MKITIIVCLLIIILTIVTILFLLRHYKIVKNTINHDVEISKKELRENLSSLNLIKQDIEVKNKEYFTITTLTKEKQQEYVKIDQNRIDAERRVNDKKEELETLNSIFAKNKQQLSEAEMQKQQILKSIDEKFQNDLKTLLDFYEDKSEEYEYQLANLREKRDAAIQVAIEEFESQSNRSFYMLQLTDNDIEDIKTLRKLENLLHNKEILGKLIYKTYIEKAYTDLIGRVLNKEDFSGIYKITNELNQMCYIGQAANIKKRWQQHIKRAVGAEPLVNNKLYPAMIGAGIENFSFEVVDKCGKDKLNEREQYWQDFYGAKVYGYSIK